MFTQALTVRFNSRQHGHAVARNALFVYGHGQLLAMTGDEAMVEKCVENVAQKDENILSLGDVARQ